MSRSGPGAGSDSEAVDAGRPGTSTDVQTPRWLRRLFVLVSVALLVLAGSTVPLPAYVELPGSAAGLAACIAIGERPDAAVNGDYLFTTVAQHDATVFGLAFAGLRDDQRVVSKGDLLGGTRRDQYLQRQRRVFVDATDRAIVVALRAAGLPVEVLGEGVDVVEVMADTPADGVLRPGDVIIAVDGTPVMTDTELIDAITGMDPLELRVRRAGADLLQEITPQQRDVAGEPRPMIGVRVTTHAPELRLPLQIDVASGRVGGPSAGLMTALAIYDLVDDGDLARGRRVAGTGTLALDGGVGGIDGVDLKVAAAAREGADLFLAPARQAAAARAALPDGSTLTVLGVDTFDQARAALQRTASDAADASARADPCRFAADV